MDFSQLESVLGLASTALGATGKAVSTVESVRKLLGSDKKPANSEAQALLNSLAAELTAANMMNVQLSEALKVLGRELKRNDEFENQKSRYELFETGEHDVVFKLKDDAADGQPIHFICPVCLNNDRAINYVVGEGDFKLCQKDKSHIYRFKNTVWRRGSNAMVV